MIAGVQNFNAGHVYQDVAGTAPKGGGLLGWWKRWQKSA
jgi:hypothetical protein